MSWITTFRRALLVVAFAGLAPVAHAQLSWEGQTGVFLNPIAYPTTADKVQASAHFIDLGRLGTLQTLGVSGGLTGGFEVGYTRVHSEVDGVRDQNLIPVKWQFLKETTKTPALALNVVFRDLTGQRSDVEPGLTATKVLPVGGTNVILSGGVRATEALGEGLFGIGHAYQFRWEAAAGVFAGKRLILATEIKEEINSRAWRDVAARYILNDHIFLDAGLANFGAGIDDQFAFGVTFKE